MVYNSDMNYRQTIIDSWKFTQENKRLIYWFGFLPSFLTTTVGIGYIAYQFFAFKKSYLFNETDESFLSDVVNFIWNFLKTHASLSVPLAIIAIVIAVLWFLVPTLFKASAIQAIARAKNGQKSGVAVGLKYGMMVFLPLFEFHLLVKTFAPFSIIIEMGFVLRNLGPAIFQMMIPAFVLIFVVSIALFLLFTYSDLFIIIDDEGILPAMKKSAKLVIFNWQQTFLITFLMIIIGVRIIIQAILVFLIPAIVILTGAFLATLALESALLIVAGIVGILALVIAAYLGGVVEIFSYTVWTFTFLELTSQKEVSARESARVLPKVERAPVEAPAGVPVVQKTSEPQSGGVEAELLAETPAIQKTLGTQDEAAGLQDADASADESPFAS